MTQEIAKELADALKAIAEGSPLSVKDDRWIVVANPKFEEDNGKPVNLVIDTWQVNASKYDSLPPDNEVVEKLFEAYMGVPDGVILAKLGNAYLSERTKRDWKIWQAAIAAINGINYKQE